MKYNPMTVLVGFVLIAALSACVTPPTDPEELAAWNAEKTARTEARRPQSGSIVANAADNPEDFETLKEELQAAKVEQNWE